MKRFEGLVAVDGVSLFLRRGEVLGIVGPNGAGKTVLMNLISGVYPPTEGEIFLEGERIDQLPASERAKKGVGRTFQIPKVFRNMTVIENLLVPAYARGTVKDRDKILEKIHSILKSLSIDHQAEMLAKNLSGGQQKLLEIARALMLDPKIFLMDEPFAGVNPVIIDIILKNISEKRREGLSYIIVSHEMPIISSVTDRVIVMDQGKIIAEGTMEEIAADQRVIEAYLGAR